MADREETDPLLDTATGEPRAPKIIRRVVVALALAAVATGAAHRLHVSTVSALDVAGACPATPGSITVEFKGIGCTASAPTCTTIAKDGIGHPFRYDPSVWASTLVEFTYGTNGDISFDISTNGKCPCGSSPNAPTGSSACWCPCSGQDGCGCYDNDWHRNASCDGTVFFDQNVRILAIKATSSPQCALGEWNGGYKPSDLRGFSTQICDHKTCPTAYLTPKSGPAFIVGDTVANYFVVEWCPATTPSVPFC